MAQQDEELTLTVTLDDQASAGLGNLQQVLSGVSAAATPATQNLAAFAKSLHGAGGHAKNLHGTLAGAIARGGLIGGAFFEIGRRVEEMGKELANATLNLKAYADETVHLEQVSRRAATTAAQFQANIATFRESGITSEAAAKNIQGFADALGDLQQEQSRLRENLLGGLRGNEFTDMVNLIRRMQSSDRQTAMMEAQKFGQDIRAYWTNQGQAERGASAEKAFFAALGIPDMDRLRGALHTVTPDMKRLYEARSENAQRFQTAVEKTSDGLDRAVRSTQAMAFVGLPIREGGEAFAEAVEHIAEWLEGWEGYVGDTDEALTRMLRGGGGFWDWLAQVAGLQGARTRQQEIDEASPAGPSQNVPLPPGYVPPGTRTWRPGMRTQLMGDGGVTGNGPGGAVDMSSIPNIGDLLKPDPANAIKVPEQNMRPGWRGLPMSTNIEDQRGEPGDPVDDNTEKMGALADELTRLNDYLAPLALQGLPFHNAPMGGSEGESNPVQLPPDASQPGGGAAAEARKGLRLTPRTAVFPNLPSRKSVVAGSPPSGVQSTKGSVYGNLSEAEGSQLPGGWVDKGDVYTEGPLKGQPLPQYTGSPRNVPGVSLPFLESAGPKGGQAGALVRVTNPLTGEKEIVQQADIGPNMFNPKSQNKGIDINAALAEKWGYAGNARQSQATGRPVFPTGAKIDWEVVTPQQLAQEHEEQQQRLAQSGAAALSRYETEAPYGAEEGAGKGFRLAMNDDASDVAMQARGSRKGPPVSGLPPGAQIDYSAPRDAKGIPASTIETAASASPVSALGRQTAGSNIYSYEQIASDQGADGGALDRASSNDIDVDTSGALDVSVTAPAGTSVKASGEGLLGKTGVTRSTPMEDARA